MPILIDGHNLIGSGVFPDINLAQEDDELQLIARLKVWRSRYRGKFTVFFDRGIPGGKDVKLGGAGVEVIFAASPTEADDLIRRRLRRKQRGLILVSNDWALRQEAQVHGVESWSGDDFVSRLGPPAAKPAPTDPGAAPDVRLSAGEVDEWMQLFDSRKPRKSKPKPKQTDTKKSAAKKNAAKKKNAKKDSPKKP